MRCPFLISNCGSLSMRVFLDSSQCLSIFTINVHICRRPYTRMNGVGNLADFMSFFSAFVFPLLTTNRAFQLDISDADSDDEDNDNSPKASVFPYSGIFDPQHVTAVALHHFRVTNVLSLFDADLGFWVKPRSTTWFSQFLLGKYDDDWWIHLFHMMKLATFALVELLKPTVDRQNKKYRLAIPKVVRVACILFKLTHGASLFVCSKMFAVGKNMVSLILIDIVFAINKALCQKIAWPSGDYLRQFQVDFFDLCRLPIVNGTINGIHFSICKPRVDVIDYFYFKPNGYTINCQAIVDTSKKRFLDLYLGMPSSTNDSRLLQRSSLFQRAQNERLFDGRGQADGFMSYLIADSGYPLLLWIMVPHRGPRALSMAKQFFNRRLRQRRYIVQNAFGILKQTFRELLVKSDLHVTFLPDVILCCALLHNVLLEQSREEVHRFLDILHQNGLEGPVEEDGDIQGL